MCHIQPKFVQLWGNFPNLAPLPSSVPKLEATVEKVEVLEAEVVSLTVLAVSRQDQGNLRGG